MTNGRYFFAFAVILWIFIPIVLNTANYYDVLGVPKNADISTIKKAFKKLSLKFHPDKNKQNPDKAKEKFTEIVNAYETLKDPEKRKQYDLLGQDGFKYGYQKGSKKQGNSKQDFKFQDFNFDDLFGSFFGTGNRKKKQREDDMFEDYFKDHEEEEKVKDQDFFSESLVLELDMATLKYFFNRKEVWVIFFYKSNQKTSLEMKEIWLDLSTKYNGIFRVAAINCLKEKEICVNQFKVKSYPTIKGYAQSKKSKGEIFTDQSVSVERIGHFANTLLKNKVKNVTKENYESFIKIQPEKFKILIFSKKNHPSILLKSLALSLSEIMNFGLVTLNEDFLFQKYKVHVLPSLYLVQNPLEYKGLKYEGEFTKEKIMIFLRDNARGIPVKIKPFAGKALPFNRKTFDIGICGENNPYLCFLLLTTQMNEKQINFLRDLAEFYKTDPIHFLFAKSNDISYEFLFPEVKSLPTFIIIKGKNHKYAVIEDFSFDVETVHNFIETTLSGSRKFYSLGALLKNAFGSNIKTEL